MSRKLMFVSTLIAVVAIGLAGCGGGGGSSLTNSTSGTTSTSSRAEGYVYGPVGSVSRAATDVTTQTPLTVTDSPLDDPNFAPVAGASVSVQGSGQSGTTDASGHFLIPNVPAGEMDLYVVPPSSSNLVPAVVHSVAGRHLGAGDHIPMPQDKLVIVPQVAVVGVGDVVQFSAYTRTDQGVVDLTSTVQWSLTTQNNQTVGTISSSGLFTASALGTARVDAVLNVTSSSTTTNTNTNSSSSTPTSQYVAHAVVQVVPPLTAISGHVTGQNNDAVPGAFVFVSGERNFAITNDQGAFFIPRVTPDIALTMTVIYQGNTVATQTVTVPSGQTVDVTIQTNVTVQPPADKPVRAVGIVEAKSTTTSWDYGTYVLRRGFVHGGPDGMGQNMATVPPQSMLALQSSTVDLSTYVGQFVEISGTRVSGYPQNGGPVLVDVTAVRAIGPAAAAVGGEVPPPPPTSGSSH